MKKIFTIFTAAFISLFTISQTAPLIQWDKTIGGNANDYLRSLIQTTDGGFLLGGESSSDLSGNKTQEAYGEGYISGSTHYNFNDFWIVKLKSSGVMEWDKTIGGTGSDYFKSIVPTSDGGFLLGGYSFSDSSGDKSENRKGGHDYWIVKIDGEGNVLWDKAIGGNKDDFLDRAIQTFDGGYFLGGYTDSGISGDKSEISQGRNDYWVIKLDSARNIEWENTIGGNRDDILNSLAQTAEGGYILGGYSISGIYGDKTETNHSTDYWIVKLDGNGNIEWDNTIRGKV